MSITNAIKTLKHEFKKGNINKQQFRTMKGQCIAGDIDGAFKGLDRIIRRIETTD